MEIISNLILHYASWPIIFIIGGIITYEDFKEGKIRNKWLKLGLALGMIYFLILISLTLLGSFQLISWQYYLPEYYLSVFINTLIAFVLGFIIWNFKLWAGGDAKLFALYVFLIPLSFYSASYYPYFPAFNLMVNIIVPIFIFLLIKMLLYPLQLFWAYLKNPSLLREYWKKYKAEHKVDKAKIKEYINTGLSFLLILIFFQLLRRRLIGAMEPYFGSFIMAVYFFVGFVIFKPLRTLFKKYLWLVILAVLSYFIIGLVYFRTELADDFLQIFAWQLIFMMSYFYIFKYGRALGKFLYNSAEVKFISIEDIGPGIFINKDYVKNLLGNRSAIDLSELEPVLSKDDWSLLSALIKRKFSPEKKEAKQKELFRFFDKLSWRSLPMVFGKYFVYKWQKDADGELMERINSQLTEEQKNELDNILHKTSDIDKFLKTIKGRLTAEQAEQLKNMIEQRNIEIKVQDLQPAEKIILHKTFSFAPFMLLGVIITLLTSSNIIHLIYQYILHR